MGTLERKQREKQRRKELILNAAIELIAEKGFDHVTMDEIATKAEFSKGTLYLYFDDKLSLFIEIKREALNKIHHDFLEVLREDIPGAMLVQKMGIRYLRFLNDHPIHTQAFLQPEITFSRKEELLEIRHELTTLLTNAIKIGIQDGSIKTKVNPKILAMQIGWGMFGILQFFLNDSETHFKNILIENDTDLKTMVIHYIDALLCYSNSNPQNN